MTTIGVIATGLCLDRGCRRNRARPDRGTDRPASGTLLGSVPARNSPKLFAGIDLTAVPVTRGGRCCCCVALLSAGSVELGLRRNLHSSSRWSRAENTIGQVFLLTHLRAEPRDGGAPECCLGFRCQATRHTSIQRAFMTGTGAGETRPELTPARPQPLVSQPRSLARVLSVGGLLAPDSQSRPWSPLWT